MTARSGARRERIEVLGNQKLSLFRAPQKRFQFELKVLQNAVMPVHGPGDLDQLPLVELVALVFLERVVVEFFGCQLSLRRAHIYSVKPSPWLREPAHRGRATPAVSDNEEPERTSTGAAD